MTKTFFLCWCVSLNNLQIFSYYLSAFSYVFTLLIFFLFLLLLWISNKNLMSYSSTLGAVWFIKKQPHLKSLLPQPWQVLGIEDGIIVICYFFTASWKTFIFLIRWWDAIYLWNVSLLNSSATKCYIHNKLTFFSCFRKQIFKPFLFS